MSGVFNLVVSWLSGLRVGASFFYAINDLYHRTIGEDLVTETCKYGAFNMVDCGAEGSSLIAV